MAYLHTCRGCCLHYALRLATVITQTRASRTRVLLLEPNASLRTAIETILAAEEYNVEPCESLQQLIVLGQHSTRTVALAAWQSMEGLLAEEHRPDLVQLTRRLRLVLMVPRRWARLLETTDLHEAVAGMVAKPFEAEELLSALRIALRAPAGN